MSRTRSTIASIVGWLIVALVAFWLLDVVAGTIRFMVRFVVWIVVLALLAAAYVRLRDGE